MLGVRRLSFPAAGLCDGKCSYSTPETRTPPMLAYRPFSPIRTRPCAAILFLKVVTNLASSIEIIERIRKQNRAGVGRGHTSFRRGGHGDDPTPNFHAVRA